MRASSFVLLILLVLFIVIVYRSFTSVNDHEVASLENSLSTCFRKINELEKEVQVQKALKQRLVEKPEAVVVDSKVVVDDSASSSVELLNQVPKSLRESDKELLRSLYGSKEVPLKLDLGNGLVITLLIDIEQMPYTSRYFLDLIERRWWDGCHVIRNAPHVIQFSCGVPHPGFRPSVAYQEYNPNKPHVAYTIGLAGRPGGPDFYISTVDNTYGHGPGGQNGGKGIVADPCFGRIAPDSVDIVKSLLGVLGDKGEGGNKFLNPKDYIEVVELSVIKK